MFDEIDRTALEAMPKAERGAALALWVEQARKRGLRIEHRVGETCDVDGDALPSPEFDAHVWFDCTLNWNGNLDTEQLPVCVADCLIYRRQDYQHNFDSTYHHDPAPTLPIPVGQWHYA